MPAGDSGRADGPAPAIAAGLIPGLELADRLDRYAEMLVRSDFRAEVAAVADRCAHLADGLSRAAEALRSADRGDPEIAERQLRSAVALLEELRP